MMVMYVYCKLYMYVIHCECYVLNRDNDTDKWSMVSCDSETCTCIYFLSVFKALCLPIGG